ncbi:sigma-E factor negative regulatory protein [Niveibacterium sp. 24ML]|uniref:sigma-E factor negative regulatory protein n=1 Tax=Niveibacterium sp. 24ML TaxID=2985512 RepID=UPI002270525B|nr:sigma-E factor negative regulatory protein [Niveibacterium sp. 24ML]MCX9158278.1 sigma-E factor negative regulatory protein [Niveibacterium sp. 24ML]
MTEQISALFDGELDAAETDRVMQALRGDHSARARWSECALIGDTLRGEAEFSKDLTAAIMARLDDEPTVLAPVVRSAPANRGLRWDRYLPIAATVAGVAVVGWMGLRSEVGPAQMALVKPAVVVQPVSANDADRAYLLAHHGYSGAQTVPAVGYYVRTASEQGGALAR